nr:MAG TPA: hypothetical protein [Caudoviricetes sp.]
MKKELTTQELIKLSKFMAMLSDSMMKILKKWL